MKFDPKPALAESTLTLPLSTGEYDIPAVSAKDGVTLKKLNGALEAVARRVKAGESQSEAANEEVERRGISLDDLDRIEELALSKDVRDRMIQDGARLREVEVAGMTAYLWQTMADGGRAAYIYWSSEGRVVPKE